LLPLHELRLDQRVFLGTLNYSYWSRDPLCSIFLLLRE
jgi:hypothetical protein